MPSHRGSPQYIGGGAPLRVETSEDADRITIAAVGDLDRETTPRLAAAIRKALDSPVERVEIDLTGVHFMDSQGLRILLEANRRAAGTTDVAIVGASGQVERLIRATGLEQILGLEPG